MKKLQLFIPGLVLVCIAFIFSCEGNNIKTESTDEFLVMAYYAGNETAIDEYDIGGLTHIIFSFCRLEGNRMMIRENRIETVRKLVSLNNDNPGLKVILARGGWGGWETFSEVFASPAIPTWRKISRTSHW